MLEALVLTLREGIEAALVVGIIVAFLRKEGGERHLGAVWAGIAAAVAASFAGAWVLSRVAVNEEVFEGLLYVGSAAVVASLTVWMWRHSHALAGHMKGSLGRILERRTAWSVAAGLFVFTFLMVFREGVETVLFLSALSLTTQGLVAWIGAAVGIVAAVAFAVFFVRGSLRIDLGRFFKVTGITLLIFTLQLLINGYHELSEAGWVPANRTTMGLIGPLVRNEFFFVAAVVALPLLLLMVPASSPPAAPAEAPAGGPQARLARAGVARIRRARWAVGSLGVAAVALLGFGFAHSQPPLDRSPATAVAAGADGLVRLPVAGLDDGDLHRFAAEAGGAPVRFIVIADADGVFHTALDACKICGDRGYARDGAEVVCLHCHSAIFVPSIGRAGGCNPIPLPSRVEGGDLVIAASDLAAAAGPGGAHHAHHG